MLGRRTTNATRFSQIARNLSDVHRPHAVRRVREDHAAGLDAAKDHEMIVGEQPHGHDRGREVEDIAQGQLSVAVTDIAATWR